jgi:hypothetical protein
MYNMAIMQPGPGGLRMQPLGIGGYKICPGCWRAVRGLVTTAMSFWRLGLGDSAGLPLGCIVGWPVGWLVGWLVGRSNRSSLIVVAVGVWGSPCTIGHCTCPRLVRPLNTISTPLHLQHLALFPARALPWLHATDCLLPRVVLVLRVWSGGGCSPSGVGARRRCWKFEHCKLNSCLYKGQVQRAFSRCRCQSEFGRLHRWPSALVDGRCVQAGSVALIEKLSL